MYCLLSLTFVYYRLPTQLALCFLLNLTMVSSHFRSVWLSGLAWTFEGWNPLVTLAFTAILYIWMLVSWVLKTRLYTLSLISVVNVGGGHSALLSINISKSSHTLWHFIEQLWLLGASFRTVFTKSGVCLVVKADCSYNWCMINEVTVLVLPFVLVSIGNTEFGYRVWVWGCFSPLKLEWW